VPLTPSSAAIGDSGTSMPAAHATPASENKQLISRNIQPNLAAVPHWAGYRPAAEQAFSHGYQVAVLIAGLGRIAAAIIAASGLRDNRRRELEASGGKPAPAGHPANPTIVAQLHHAFVTRPDGGPNHVNH
jgi:hypothetical protein